MAWISVHEQVIGGKLRSLAKEIGCSQNEALGLLVRLWLWGINNADKEGRIIGADKADMAEVLTIGIDERYSPKDVVEAMIAKKWIDEEGALFFHDWDEWQEQWYKAVEVREKNAERKRKERSRKRMLKEQAKENSAPNKDIPREVMEDLLPNPQLNISPAEPKKQKPVDSYMKDFEKIWELYPRRVGKGEGYKKYKARLNDGWKPEELLEAVKAYSNKVARERTEPQYIKHMKTFFSDSTPFIDFLPNKEKSAPQTSSGNDDDPYADWR